MNDPRPTRVFGEGGRPTAAIVDRPAEPRPVRDLLQDALQDAVRRATGKSPSIHTGFTSLDEKMGGGIEPTSFMVIGARPGHGKTALGLTIARRVAGRRPVLVFSLEVGDEQLGRRLICSESAVVKGGPVPYRIMRNPTSMPELNRYVDAIKASVDRLREADLWAVSQRVTISQVVTISRQWAAARGHPAPLVVIDYLQLLKTEPLRRNETRERVVAEQSATLKELAKLLHGGVLCLAQLNRATEKENRRPRVSDLRESGAIEQDADVIALLDRPVVRDPVKHAGSDLLSVRLAKQREAESGVVVDLIFNGATQAFSEKGVAWA